MIRTLWIFAGLITIVCGTTTFADERNQGGSAISWVYTPFSPDHADQRASGIIERRQFQEWFIKYPVMPGSARIEVPPDAEIVAELNLTGGILPLGIAVYRWTTDGTEHWVCRHGRFEAHGDSWVSFRADLVAAMQFIMLDVDRKIPAQQAVDVNRP